MGWYEKVVAVLPVGEPASTGEIARRLGCEMTHCGDIARALGTAVKYGLVRRIGHDGRFILWERVE